MTAHIYNPSSQESETRKLKVSLGYIERSRIKGKKEQKCVCVGGSKGEGRGKEGTEGEKERKNGEKGRVGVRK